MTNTLDWMLSHKGYAVAKKIDKDNIEIIKTFSDSNDFEKMKKYAKQNGYYIVVGNDDEENRLGYFTSRI